MDVAPFISAIVSALVAIVGAYSATRRASEADRREHAEAIARLETKMDVLSERVEKHNNVMERTAKLETEVANLYHRYDEISKIKIGGTE